VRAGLPLIQTELVTLRRERLNGRTIDNGYICEQELRSRPEFDRAVESGLCSLDANEPGAQNIVSIDLYPASVEATERVRALAGSPVNWKIMRGDIPDDHLQIKNAYFVYSWGELHHTGQIHRVL